MTTKIVFLFGIDLKLFKRNVDFAIKVKTNKSYFMVVCIHRVNENDLEGLNRIAL
jgi:hypothetical protein